MARLAAFAFLVAAAFAWIPPWIDRPGLAALGFAFLAFATPRPRTSVWRRAAARLAAPITLPTEDAGQTPDSLLARLEPYAVARVSTLEQDGE